MNRKYFTRLLSRMTLPLISVLLLLAGPAYSAQTVHIFLEIDGNQIEGDSTVQSLERAGSIEAYNFGFNVSTPRDTASGQLTGRRQYRPITFLKRFDRSSPLLFKALAMNEQVTSLEARFYRPTPAGGEEHFFTILLENGYISSINQVSDASPESGAASELISVVFQTITMTYEPNGATHTDVWSAQQ